MSLSFYLVSTVEATFYDTNLLYYIIMILLFSNQKGGVGKSTLAALYANHLANGDENAGIMPRRQRLRRLMSVSASVS